MLTDEERQAAAEPGISRTTAGKWNKSPRPLTWTESANEILETLAPCCRRLTPYATGAAG